MTFSISAIIPVFGPQPLLQRAVDSVMANAEINELIVVDDGSPGPLNLRAHSKLRVIRNELNKGPAAARNAGARLAASSWLAFLDADDVWRKNKSSIQIDALMKDRSGAIGAVCAFGFERGAQHIVCRPPQMRLQFEHALKGARFGLGSTMLISQSAFMRSNGYNEDYSRYEDWEWLLRVVRAGHFLTLQEELVTITHGYRAKPSIALPALSLLETGVLKSGLSRRQAKDFKAAVALERSSLLLSSNRRSAAACSVMAAMLQRPSWVSRAVFRRLADGSVPGT